MDPLHEYPSEYQPLEELMEALPYLTKDGEKGLLS
jgi:indoleamine 2,3-dioxygenase